MASLLLPDLPAPLHEQLLKQAADHHRSPEEEVIFCLTSLLLDPISIPAADAERSAWLAQSEARLTHVWDNSADDVYHALLTP